LVKIHLRRIGRFVLNFIEDWSSFNQAIQAFDQSIKIKQVVLGRSSYYMRVTFFGTM
jgi:hypothetical protein